MLRETDSWGPAHEFPEGNEDFISARICDRSYFYDSLAKNLDLFYLCSENMREVEFKNDD